MMLRHMQGNRCRPLFGRDCEYYQSSIVELCGERPVSGASDMVRRDDPTFHLFVCQSGLGSRQARNLVVPAHSTIE